MHSKEIITIADSRILAIPIVDNQDPVIDVKAEQCLVIGPSPEIPDNQDYTKMRRAVYEKILEAQRILPSDLCFCLYEAYRSLNLQKMLFEFRYAQIEKLYPDWTEQDIFTESTKLISPVINLDGSTNIPPHSTGGAVDLYLLDKSLRPVDMGIHPADWMKDADGRFSETDSSCISNTAKKYRQIMSEVLTAVGFINYPTEYWHWSYGDRYWAYFQPQPQAALYDSI